MGLLITTSQRVRHLKTSLIVYRLIRLRYKSNLVGSESYLEGYMLVWSIKGSAHEVLGQTSGTSLAVSRLKQEDLGLTKGFLITY